MSCLSQGQPGPLLVDDDYLRVASTGTTGEEEEKEEDNSDGAIVAGVIVPLVVIATVLGIVIFIWYYRLVYSYMQCIVWQKF